MSQTVVETLLKLLHGPAGAGGVPLPVRSLVELTGLDARVVERHLSAMADLAMIEVMTRRGRPDRVRGCGNADI